MIIIISGIVYFLEVPIVPVAVNEFSSTSAMSSNKPFHVYTNQTMVDSKHDITISHPFKRDSSIRWEFECKILFPGWFWSYILSYLCAFLLQFDN